jgi:Flp pilus assembly protein TadB
MFTEEFGHKMLGLAALLMTVGTLVMRGIIRKTLS